jgi:peptidoglycan hydrolase CwlO-like protein
MSVKNIFTVVLATAVTVGFMGLGVTDAVNRKDKVEFQQVQLKSRAAEIQELNVKYDSLNIQLNEASQKDQAEKQEVERLQKEKEELDKQKKELEAQLQAKLEAKSKLAVASEKVANSATATQTASAAPQGSLHSIIAAAASRYGVSYDMMIRMATCESTMGANLRNPSPVIVNGVNYGHAEGVFQFIPSTWTRMSSQAGYGGASVYDTVANVNTAAWAFANGNKGEWECQ